MSDLQERRYKEIKPEETVKKIKISLFGPLAGIGDALFWFTLLPITAGICASLSDQGNILGPIVFFLVFFAAFLLRFPLARMGYKTGTKALDKLQENTKRVIAQEKQRGGVDECNVCPQGKWNVLFCNYDFRAWRDFCRQAKPPRFSSQTTGRAWGIQGFYSLAACARKYGSKPHKESGRARISKNYSAC